MLSSENIGQGKIKSQVEVEFLRQLQDEKMGIHVSTSYDNVEEMLDGVFSR